MQQRNGRKTLTIVEGIDINIDPKKLVKDLKKLVKCNGSVSTSETYGEVIQLQGDHRLVIKDFLVKYGIAKEEEIRLHGA